jgi:hypothetical protein
VENRGSGREAPGVVIAGHLPPAEEILAALEVPPVEGRP